MNTMDSLRAKLEIATDMESVVKTMKMLAAVSIHQYERAVAALEHYNHTVELGFQILLRDPEFRQRVLAKKTGNQRQKTGWIVFGSDQGMCGPFNERIVSFALAEQDTDRDAGQNAGQGIDRKLLQIIAVGNRAEQHLGEFGLPIDRTLRVPTSVSEITRTVQELLLAIDQWQIHRQISRLLIFYNRRCDGSFATPTGMQLLPIGRDRYLRWSQSTWKSTSLPGLTMNRRRLLSCVIRQYLFVALYQACTESLSSENASRIASMQVAEKSIQQRIETLASAFNQLRQTAITEELLDVVSGFEALGGGTENRSTS